MNLFAFFIIRVTQIVVSFSTGYIAQLLQRSHVLPTLFNEKYVYIQLRE